MLILLLNLVAAVVTVILGRRDPRALVLIGLGALVFGVASSGVALASSEWALFYVVALAVSYGLAVLFGRLMATLCGGRNGVGSAARD